MEEVALRRDERRILIDCKRTSEADIDLDTIAEVLRVDGRAHNSGVGVAVKRALGGVAAAANQSSIGNRQKACMRHAGQ